MWSYDLGRYGDTCLFGATMDLLWFLTTLIFTVRIFVVIVTVSLMCAVLVFAPREFVRERRRRERTIADLF